MMRNLRTLEVVAIINYRCDCGTWIKAGEVYVRTTCPDGYVIRRCSHCGHMLDGHPVGLPIHRRAK